MKFPLLSMVCLSLMTLLLACKGEPEPEEVLEFPSEDRSYAFFLDDYIDSVMSVNRIPGLAVGVINDNDIAWTKGYGQANIEENIPVTKNTRFMLTRPSDLIVSVVLIDLMQENGLSLDADINTILPDPIYHGRFPAAVLTPRMLLSHTSGIIDNPMVLDSVYSVGDSPIRLRDFIYEYFGENGIYASEDNFDPIRPGRLSKYSRMNIALAAYLVEAITGLEFDLYCKLTPFSQLGYSSVSWFLFDMQPEKLAVPYLKMGNQLIAQEQYGYPMYPSGLLRINVEYAARFLQALMQNGVYGDQTIISSGALNQVKTVQYDHLDPDQALGWRYTDLNGRELLGLAGQDVGHSGRMYMQPGTGKGIVIMTNGAGYEDALDAITEQVFTIAEQL